MHTHLAEAAAKQSATRNLLRLSRSFDIGLDKHVAERVAIGMCGWAQNARDSLGRPSEVLGRRRREAISCTGTDAYGGSGLGGGLGLSYDTVREVGFRTFDVPTVTDGSWKFPEAIPVS